MISPVRKSNSPQLKLDLADVKGQPGGVLALEIAAAGGHNLLLEGPPGTGKTMLAQRLPTILPPLTEQEAVEVTRIHSVAGLSQNNLVTNRPFRAPHHTVSAVGLVGGGREPSPGEVSFAHRGVLFLDELAEFQRNALEVLRQPLEQGYVTIVRAQRSHSFPASFMLVAATNPCPCGMGGTSSCRCSSADLARYQRKLSGPLLDRIDLLVNLQPPSGHLLTSQNTHSSSCVRERVLDARERQRHRLAHLAVELNSQINPSNCQATGPLTTSVTKTIEQAYRSRKLSMRGYKRVLRVARTIADLDCSSTIKLDHLLQALSLRPETLTSWELV